MKFERIYAIIMRNLYLYKRSFPRIFDVTLWPVLDILLWGFLGFYLQSYNLSGVNILSVLLGAIIFWEFLNHSQRSISIAFLEEVWEKNFLNIFVTPISIKEFLVSIVAVGLVRIFLVSIALIVVSFFAYSFNIFSLGFMLIPFVVNLLFFGATLGIFVISIILRYGTSAQILAFGMLFLIQPFSAVFYPVSALPHWAQLIANAIPTTYVFEGMRGVMAKGIVPYHELLVATVINIIYLVVVLIFFRAMFRKVKEMGRLLKLD